MGLLINKSIISSNPCRRSAIWFRTGEGGPDHFPATINITEQVVTLAGKRSFV